MQLRSTIRCIAYFGRYARDPFPSYRIHTPMVCSSSNSEHAWWNNDRASKPTWCLHHFLNLPYSMCCHTVVCLFHRWAHINAAATDAISAQFAELPVFSTFEDIRHSSTSSSPSNQLGEKNIDPQRQGFRSVFTPITPRWPHILICLV
jgi:hypothetical protein